MLIKSERGKHMCKYEEPLVSVIIPVYNVEKYLQQCVYSALNQTLENIEIILIDDGSTDSSGKICDELSNCYYNITAIHKKNGGLSSARNLGIEHSSGKYIAFLDSDDYVLPKMYEVLYELCEINNTKIASCDYYNVYGDSIQKPSETSMSYKLKSEEFFRKILTENGRIEMCAVNKLYHRSIFESIDNRFPESKLFEDLGTMYKLVFSTDYISYINQGFYCYRRQREGSITKTWNFEREIDRFLMGDNMTSFIQQHVPSLYYDSMAFKFMNTYLTCVNLMIDTNNYSSELYNIVRRGVLENLNIINESNLNINKKIQILICAINYTPYKWIYKILKVFKNSTRNIFKIKRKIL